MPINSRQKGARCEREAATLLKTTFAVEARRGQQYCGGSDSHDIFTSLPLNVEVKAVEKLNLELALDQAERDAKPGTTPVVLSKRNRKDWVVSVRWKHLEDLVKILAKAISERDVA